MSRVPTPNEVVLRLIQTDRDLDANVDALETAEAEAIEKRHDADLSYSHAFLRAAGSVEQRKHLAFVECERLLHEAEVAEAVVRHLKRRAHAIDHHTDTARSANKAVNAEANSAGYGAP